MVLSEGGKWSGEDKVTYPRQEVFRVIDDGTCVLTTLDARKALFALMDLIDKNDITVCWAEAEPLV